MQVTPFAGSVSGTSERFAGFAAHLRNNGLAVGVAETAAMLRALRDVNLHDARDVRLACRAVCTSQWQEFNQFDDLFDSYWFNRGRERSEQQATDQAQEQSQRSRFQPGVNEQLASGGHGRADQPDSDDSNDEVAHGSTGRLIASQATNTAQTDFRELMTPESIAEAEKIAERLARAIRDRRSRRYRTSNNGRRLNLRKTIRASVSLGGVPLRLFRQQHPERPTRLVALLDVSGSMTVYARVFLAFIRGLVSHDTYTDAYLFHTRLVRISDTLRDRNTLRAANRLSLLVRGFGGGTKIGANLDAFNRQYAGGVNGRTVVLILSDGYDTGPASQLAASLQQLKKRNCRIVWLNPLKGWKDYSPVAQGMAAALPWIDCFAPANTLDSLAALEPQLNRL